MFVTFHAGGSAATGNGFAQQMEVRMKLKTNLLVLTAASILACSTAFAATEGSSEPQPGASQATPDSSMSQAQSSPSYSSEAPTDSSSSSQASGSTEPSATMQSPQDQAAVGSESSDSSASAQAPSEQLPSASESTSASGAGMAGGSTQQLDSQTVQDIQQALNDKGFDSGKVDGIMGPNTQKALRDFQEDQGMQASGQPDQETLSALGIQG